MNKTGIRIQEGHLHSISYYEPTHILHFIFFLYSFFVAKKYSCKSICQHLPFEIEHPKVYKNIKGGRFFISFGEFLKRIFNMKLYWENSPVLVIGTWKLKHGQTNWDMIPNEIELCLDTGHLMLGSSSVEKARQRIQDISQKFGNRIKHLHIHENDLCIDKHWKPLSKKAEKKVFTKLFLTRLLKNRTHIFEIPAKLSKK